MSNSIYGMQYAAIHYNNYKLTITNCIERNNHSGY